MHCKYNFNFILVTRQGHRPKLLIYRVLNKGFIFFIDFINIIRLSSLFRFLLHCVVEINTVAVSFFVPIYYLALLTVAHNNMLWTMTTMTLQTQDPGPVQCFSEESCREELLCTLNNSTNCEMSNPNQKRYFIWNVLNK